MSSVNPIQIPSRLPLLLTHESVLLPGSTMRTSVDTARNLQLVRSRLLKGTSLQSTILGVIPNTPDPASDSQDLPPLHRIGTAALAVQVVGSNWPKPHYTLLITGLCRFQIMQVLKEKPYPVAEVEQLDRLEEFPNTCKTREELGELSEQFYRYSVQLVEMLDMSVPAVAKLRRLLDSLPREALPDILTSIIRTSNKEKLQILDAVSLEERFKMTIPLLVRQIEGLKLLQKTRKPKQDDDKRVIAIRPIRRITHIPGALEDEEEEEDNDDIVMLEKKIRTSSMPEQAHKVCVKEIKRLKKMPQSMPEYALTRNYLELMVELPWNKSTTDRLDIRAARILLDNDHYAMEKLKRRVLEYLAVRQLKNNLKGPILCFVGPPGVGKTSVGRSVAKTLGREFHRIALGGVCDQSDIRGHRRTYVGSMPGRIINGLKTVGVNNPVFLLDEVDKLGKSLQGDPAAALLEVLDPEQNHNFTDHYLNVAFDLSQVLFIATANTTATIPPALLDRMEIIQVPGYTQEEKIEIAHRHLIPKQLEQHGLTPQQIQIPQLTTLAIITRLAILQMVLILTECLVCHSNQQAFLLENVPCNNASCEEVHRMFKVYWDLAGLNLIKDAMVATFFDIYEDGILDIIVLSKGYTKSDVAIHTLKNNFEADAYFVKVIVLSGLCSSDCPRKITPFGVNQPGPYIMYTTVDANGYLKNGSGKTTASQSSSFSIQASCLIRHNMNTIFFYCTFLKMYINKFQEISGQKY
ncbi:lon protease homolog 2, peroxisomal-like [Rattus rattus]|uniref:lon protease homolog 2, peroxisomal-like n=1 Tax=Rattus rattus TaxID=10117 RepID=UPI0013F37A24|nr:lon protease homolog 2, peroxisomal-like [Rattus rattus]